MPKPAITGVISEGTLRPEDVVPRLVETLEVLDPERAKVLYLEWSDVLRDLADNEYSSEAWNDYLDSINTALPSGWYCGSLEGDGACFGIWQDDWMRDTL